VHVGVEQLQRLILPLVQKTGETWLQNFLVAVFDHELINAGVIQGEWGIVKVLLDQFIFFLKNQVDLLDVGINIEGFHELTGVLFIELLSPLCKLCFKHLDIEGLRISLETIALWVCGDPSTAIAEHLDERSDEHYLRLFSLRLKEGQSIPLDDL
jgi:hypothetical protein